MPKSVVKVHEFGSGRFATYQPLMPMALDHMEYMTRWLEENIGPDERVISVSIPHGSYVQVADVLVERMNRRNGPKSFADLARQARND